MGCAMNYYPFHIGDYASATRHLSWDEDAAYRRLLDVYYTHEKPIPDAKVIRFTGAQTKSQREAVATVLSEFFVLGEEGWRHERCDSEIDSMRVKQAMQEEKDAHETERMRRYRERRAAMFEALRAVSIVPAWDVGMKELQRLFDTYCNANGNGPATNLQREQVVSGEEPATAIPTPTPIPIPILNSLESAKTRSTKKCPKDFGLTDDMAEWAKENAPLVLASVELEKLKDHTFGTARSDWVGTWRNWMRKAQQDAVTQAARNATRNHLTNTNRYSGAAAAIFDGATHV